MMGLIVFLQFRQYDGHLRETPHERTQIRREQVRRERNVECADAEASRARLFHVDKRFVIQAEARHLLRGQCVSASERLVGKR